MFGQMNTMERLTMTFQISKQSHPILGLFGAKRKKYAELIGLSRKRKNWNYVMVGLCSFNWCNQTQCNSDRISSSCPGKLEQRILLYRDCTIVNLLFMLPFVSFVHRTLQHTCGQINTTNNLFCLKLLGKQWLLCVLHTDFMF